MAAVGRVPGVRLVCSFLARILGLITVVGTAARYLPTSFSAWPFMPELVSLTPWFAVTGLLALILATLTRRWLTALIALACLGANGFWQYTFFTGGHDLPQSAAQIEAARQPDKNDDAARVMTANVYKGRADAQTIVNCVRDNRIEVLALQETTPAFVERLEQAGIGNYLPYSKVSSSDGVYGNGLWSMTPMSSLARDDVGSSASQMPAGTVSFAADKQVRFVSVHTMSPGLGKWGLWKQTLDELGRMKEHTHTRYIFMGDFNATYDHAPFRDLLGDRFIDAAHRSAHGFTLTWPADRTGIPPLVAIDHIVLDQNMEAGQLKTVSIPGSDHRALIGTVWIG